MSNQGRPERRKVRRDRREVKAKRRETRARIDREPTSGKGGIRSARLLQVFLNLQPMPPALIRQWIAHLWSVLVVCGCLGQFGILHSTKPAHSDPFLPPNLCSAPARQPGSAPSACASACIPDLLKG
jgi:hypothetical protein